MELNELISIFLQGFLTLALPLVAVPLAKFLLARAAYYLAEAKAYNPDAFDYLAQFAQFAVIAAEQAHAGEWIDDKREYAFAVVEKLLAEKGITLDIDLIYAAIEKSVREEFGKPAPALPE